MQTNTQATRVGAYGLITQNKKILLCRLSQQVPNLKGLWILPGGGLDFGEDTRAALVREVEEETGLLVTPTKLAEVDTLYDRDSNPAFHGVRIIYHATVQGGTLRDELMGTTDKAAWFSESEARNLPLIRLAKTGLDIAYSQK
jgi:ADP-ribose pyrophosphatase YjhB (NUDIX family)